MASTADEAIATIKTSTQLLNDGLVALTLKQNEDKAEHVPSFLGIGQEKFTRHCTKEVYCEGMGTGKSVAKYLGNFCSFDSNNKSIIATRIYKAKEAFYSLGKLWETNITMAVRCMTYKGYVVSALLTGLECEPLRQSDKHKLEMCQNGLIRRALNGISNKLVEGTMHQSNNENTRKLMKVCTVHSTLTARRIKCMQNIIAPRPLRKRTTKGSSMWPINYKGGYDYVTIQSLASDHSGRHS